MSGSTGAKRVKKADVQPTINNYIKEVLSKWPGWGGKYAYTGSYVVGKKSDYGDIDIVITAKGSDKKSAKANFAKWLVDNYGDKPDVLMPFESSRWKGRLYLNTGEIITIHYPQAGKDYGCQIDNMFAMSDEEFIFKQQFLNLPAEEQGLVLGLVKIATIEDDPKDIFSRMNISANADLPEGWEWEFNLSGSALQLRKVNLDKNYKQISRSIEWKSQNWKDVETLLSGYSLSSGFSSLLSKASSNLKNKRSGKRMIGIFKSMITVKSGEVGTEKGMNKLRAIDAIERTLGESNTFLKYYQFMKLNEGLTVLHKDKGLKRVNIFVGRFQPFTLGHGKVINALYKENGLKTIIFLIKAKKKKKDDEEKRPFDEDLQTKMINALKNTYPIEDVIILPSASIDKMFNELRPNYEPVLWGAGSDRMKSFGFQVNKEKYREDLGVLDNFKLFEIPRTDDNISATKVRSALIDDDFDAFKSMTPKPIHKMYNELKSKLKSPKSVD